MEILPLNQSDLNLLSAIQPLDWTDISIPIQFYLKAAYCFPFKAIIDGKFVGTGTAILHKKTGWLSTIITHSGYRNQGIGKMITEHLVHFLKSHNCDHIYLIATALGEPVYKKAGFNVHCKYAFYGDINLQELEISEFIIPFQTSYKKAIFKIDYEISGENRSQHLEPFMEDSFVYFENGIVKGAYFPTFGDGLVIAESEKAGIELMKKRFQNFKMASIPEENLAANNFMKSMGYLSKVSNPRMYFGKQMNWNPMGVFNRVGGKIG